MTRSVLARYDRKSVVVLVMAAFVYAGIGLFWNDLLRENLSVVNWYLVAIWIAMTALVCWDVRPSQDAALAVTALVGGWTFEWWGTHTGLWWYFTGEKPPLWILPAWPVAALATVRIAYGLEALLSRLGGNFRLAYWVLAAGFVLWMTRFLWPSVRMPATWVALAALVAIAATGGQERWARRDVSLFLAGLALGIFLEYWGTSRNCWTYYTREVPPPVTAAAHGFAQIVYARVLAGLDRILQNLGFSWPVGPREYPHSAVRHGSGA